jgi:hypothetical protein
MMAVYRQIARLIVPIYATNYTKHRCEDNIAQISSTSQESRPNNLPSNANVDSGDALE